ncbi:MAG: hypothetical protein VB119_07150 [Candidatus Metalachnospira sp.]|nr:hypothetical protein [Candidatus Metalachnospira sp.]
MKNWDEQIRAAEQRIKETTGKKNINTITVRHEHGFIVMELESFFELPKSQQNKILKLGGF